MSSDKSLFGMIAAVVVVLILAFSIGFAGSGASTKSPGRNLAAQAEADFGLGDYTKALGLFEEAAKVLAAEGDEAGAVECREKALTSALYLDTYPYSEEALRGVLAESFPEVPEATREGWITGGQLEHWEIDGSIHYQGTVVDNLKYRNLELFLQDPALHDFYSDIIKRVDEEIIPASDAKPNQPYVNPETFKGNSTLKVPRDQLPESGELSLWWPVPILEGPQRDVTVTEISPGEYAPLPPSIAGDIGLTYMEVPLDKLKGDLEASVQFQYTRSEQRFAVDPSNVGEYDKESALYRQYTASHGNIAITPEIESKALEVVGGENNPYLAARKLYYYIADNVQYSLMPHAVLWPRGEPESLYVHERGYGDCGAQSMYFCALARSLGIPARCTGGFQLLKGDFASHFWAEFYLPNYGWVPVDTSLGQISNYCPELPEEQRNRFKDFYFGNLDAFRCVVQNDVDLPFVPPAGEMTYLPTVVQSVQFSCPTMTLEQLPQILDGYAIHTE